MKKQITLIATFLLVSLLAFAQGEAYEATMLKNIEQMKAAKTVEELQQTANVFERIVRAEQKEWLPLYYASLSYINMSAREQKDTMKDQYLDKAQAHLGHGFKLMPKESELHVLQGYLHLMRISVSPMVRGMKYSGLATEAFEMAKKINPENPRAYYMLGTSKFNTPAMFGGGPEAAKPFLVEAKAKFSQHQPSSPIAPQWGEKHTLSLLEECK